MGSKNKWWSSLRKWAPYLLPSFGRSGDASGRASRHIGRGGKPDGQECDGAEGPGREHQDSHRSFVGHQRGGAGAGAGRSPGLGFCGVPADPLQQAVVHLADIVKATTGKKRSGSKLETALEATGGLSSDSVTVGTSKRSAAARRALRSMLTNHPEEFYGMVEKLMMEDIMS